MAERTQSVKAYSYLRFSTPEQMKGDSFRRQASLAKDYAARHDLELDDTLTFHDLGVSAYRGKNAETGQLGAFLQAVREGMVQPGSYLLVESLDRISRLAARKALRVLEEIVDEGVTVVTLSDGRAYDKAALDGDPMSLMLALMIFIRANEESATKSRRLKASWLGKRLTAREKKLTARCPAWLTLNENQFVVNEGRAEIVRMVYRLTAEGVGQHKIAETLNLEGVPCFGSAKHWHRSYIKKLLGNSAVIGRLVPHEIGYEEGKRLRHALEPIDLYYPAIVPEELYEAIQAQRTAGRAPIVRVGHAISNMLAGLAKCPRCGGTMTRVSKGSKGRSGKPFLVCQKAKAGAGCEYHSVPQEQIEQTLTRSVADWLGDRPSGGESLNAQLEEARGDLSDMDGMIEAVLRQVAMGPSPTLSRRLAELEGKKEALEKTYRDLLHQYEAASSASIKARSKALRASLEKAPLDKAEANALLRQLLTSVTIDHESQELEFHWIDGVVSRITYVPPFKPIKGGWTPNHAA